jgi:isopentenyl-diphosphate delta-isomerase type 1
MITVLSATSGERITIVDENDVVIGAETRRVARSQGLRHRIVRVFLVNAAGQILLQRRSLELDDNPGKWDQSVGGHVDEGEDYEAAARRETQEELGVTLTAMRNVGKVYIERPAADGFIRRFQAVFVAQYDGPLVPNSDEVAEVRWFSSNEIKDWYAAKPSDFTKSFIKAFALLDDVI